MHHRSLTEASAEERGIFVVFCEESCLRICEYIFKKRLHSPFSGTSALEAKHAVQTRQKAAHDRYERTVWLLIFFQPAWSPQEYPSVMCSSGRRTRLPSYHRYRQNTRLQGNAVLVHGKTS
mmetsp:Transcript_19498/g.36037  ORF Transcript_19498/g.36037 Transcript_19498/m.36037 type:complete len:121 (+) Transcript_19498:104-466(+)